MRAPARPGPSGAPAVAAAGAVAMAVEMLLPRTLAPHVGTTLPVWTAVFAVVLAGLAAGAALGGRLADRLPRRAVDAAALVLAAPAVAAIPWIAPAALDLAAGASLAVRAILGAAAAAFVPMALLGAVYPPAARAAVAGSDAPARALGRLAAAGALGSLLGVVGTAEGLVPHVPTSMGYALLALACALAGVLRWRSHARAETATARPPSGVGVEAHARDPLPLGPVLLLAALAGTATLALEVLTARATAVLAGSGLATWTAVIGVVLAGLAAGGALGGRLAGRVPAGRLLARLLLLGALATALGLRGGAVSSALLALPGLPFAARVAAAVAARFGPAFLLLGALPPVLARAALADPARDGRRVGLVSAVATGGALLGALATGPWLLPALDLEGALAALATALCLAGAAAAVGGRLRAREGAAFALALAAALLVGGPLVAPGGDASAWVRDGPYARIRVDAAPPDRAFGRAALRLWIDDRVHGVQDPADATWPAIPYAGLFLAVAERAAPEGAAPRALFLGGGSCSVPRLLLAARPGARIDVAEIDPTVTAAARARLGLAVEPGFSVAHEDARTFVRRLPPDAAPYDLVFSDAFGEVSVPAHLATREFLLEVRVRMAPGGVFVANLIDAFDEGRFLAAYRATLASVFRRVRVFGGSRDDAVERNFVVVASDRDVPLEGLSRTDPAAPSGPRLPAVRYDDEELDALARRAGAFVLTDDFAPVEDLLGPVLAARATR